MNRPPPVLLCSPQPPQAGCSSRSVRGAEWVLGAVSVTLQAGVTAWGAEGTLYMVTGQLTDTQPRSPGVCHPH